MLRMQVHVKVLPTFREFLFKVKAREKVLYGGSGSGKTYSTQQYALRRACEEPNDSSLVVMETRPGNLTGMFYPMCEMLESWGVGYESRETAPAHITTANGHTIWFTSADKSEKMKYFDNIKRVIINEATALQEDDFQQLMNRMGRTKPAEIIFTFNPIDDAHWLVQRYVLPFLENKLPPDVAVHHSTYHDNKFLSAEWCDWLESRMKADPNFYRVYALGEPGHLEGLIYAEGQNWKHVPANEFPNDVKARPPLSVGIDWGMTDPTAVVGIWEENGIRYAHEFIYSSDLIPSDLIGLLKTLIQNNRWPPNVLIYGDPSRKDTIEDFARHGFNIVKADNTVFYGIGAVKDKPLVVSDESTNLIRELRNYRWKFKANAPTDEPVDAFNHALDALRYAIATRAEPPKHWTLRVSPAAPRYQRPTYGGH
jgi:phage terminase large subunit